MRINPELTSELAEISGDPAVRHETLSRVAAEVAQSDFPNGYGSHSKSQVATQIATWLAKEILGTTEYESRLAHCRDCAQCVSAINHTLLTCNLCGCIMTVKARFRTLGCPEGRF